MSNPYINIAPDSWAWYEGEIEYSHFVRPYEGEELARQIQRQENHARQTGKQRYIIKSPYTKITLKNARVLKHNPPTPLEQVLEDNLYIDDKRRQDGRNHTVELINKSAIPPRFGSFPEVNGTIDFSQGKTYPIDKELKVGQKVRVQMKVFRTSNGCGCGIERVMALGDPQFYEAINTFDLDGMSIVDGPRQFVQDSSNTYTPMPEESDTYMNYPQANTNAHPMPSPYSSAQYGQMAQPSNQTRYDPNINAAAAPAQNAGNNAYYANNQAPQNGYNGYPAENKTPNYNPQANSQPNPNDFGYDYGQPQFTSNGVVAQNPAGVAQMRNQTKASVGISPADAFTNGSYNPNRDPNRKY